MERVVPALNGIELQLLQTMVPVNALTLDHLESLLRNTSVETICAGSSLLSALLSAREDIYLLSGSIELKSPSQRWVGDAHDPRCRFPLSQLLPSINEALALSDCTVIRIDRIQLDNILAWDQASHYIMLELSANRELDGDADWMTQLLTSNLFYKVPPMNIRQILDRFKAIPVAAGDTIIRQGELGECCYFIKQGRVGVYQAASERSASQIIAELGGGRCFGEDALINDAPRNATITMLSDGVLMKLDKTDFFLLLKPPQVNTVSLAAALIAIAAGGKWIDVRTEDEYDHGHSDGAINMPLKLLKLKSRMLNDKCHYIVYCNSGRRSEAAVKFLADEGLNVSFLERGIERFSSDSDSLFTRS